MENQYIKVRDILGNEVFKVMDFEKNELIPLED